MAKGVQRLGLHWDFLKELSIIECWLYYAEYIEVTAIDRYAANPPVDNNNKTIAYKPKFYINNG